MFAQSKIIFPLLALPLLFGAAVSLHADFFALDPGVRGDPAGAGGPIDGLSANEKIFFEAGLEAFNEVQDVQGDDPGLGPRFNLDSCAGRSEEHTSELQSLAYLVCRLLLEKKKITES